MNESSSACPAEELFSLWGCWAEKFVVTVTSYILPLAPASILLARRYHVGPRPLEPTSRPHMATRQSRYLTNPSPSESDFLNVGEPERWISVAGGALAALYGAKRGGLGGLVSLAAGGILLYRGTTGHCPLFAQLGIDTAHESAASPIYVHETLTVKGTPEELYQRWRDLERLPTFMRHLQSVRETSERRSTWSARVPKTSETIEWEAEIVEEQPGELLGWRSVEHADVHNAGTVRFAPAPSGRGTEVRVTIEYRPPAGELGAQAARLLNPILSQLIREDIRRFKHLVETGELPTTKGQPRS